MRRDTRGLKKRSLIVLVFALLDLACCSALQVDNAITQTKFTADPAPLVYQGTVYLYTGHDEDDATSFKMLDWQLYTSTDMVNWTDHGAIASLATFPWARQDNDAWAPQVVERSGKFYLYAPVSVPGEPKTVIGVAVADSPLGPFHDALGHPLIGRREGAIDPTVFIDEDGQAYLYWGNPDLWFVRLNRDMVSYSGAISKVETKPANYQEGPWFYRRRLHYYMAYASHCCPEGIGYAMSDHATGPWQYKGMLMDPDPRSSGNHPGIVDFEGKSYLFGFSYVLSQKLTSVHRERRSVAVARFHYNEDGTIDTLPWWDQDTVSQLRWLDPYALQQAATIAWSQGLRTMQSPRGEVYVTATTNGSFLIVRGVDFGKASAARLRVAMRGLQLGATLEAHLDSAEGKRIASIAVPSVTNAETWKNISVPILTTSGVHDLVFVFHGQGAGPILSMMSWVFEHR